METPKRSLRVAVISSGREVSLRIQRNNFLKSQELMKFVGWGKREGRSRLGMRRKRAVVPVSRADSMFM